MRLLFRGKLLLCDFHLFLLLVGGGCILSIYPCCHLHTYPHRVVKEPYFETLIQKHA